MESEINEESFFCTESRRDSESQLLEPRESTAGFRF